jgi:hypothetical protein
LRHGALIVRYRAKRKGAGGYGAVRKQSATICDCCGLTGVLSCTAARFPWYAVSCDGCRVAGWVLAAEWKERRRPQAD